MADTIPTPPSNVRAALSTAFRRARDRARTSGRAFTITKADVFAMAELQEWRCAVSGLAFDMRRFETALVGHPFAPSIDRIDAGTGYVEGNVRLVLVAVNFGLGSWGDEVFLAIARATVRRERDLLDAADDLSARIVAAEAMTPLLEAEDRPAQIRRVAGLKAARTKGPTALRAAALKAWASKRESER